METVGYTLQLVGMTANPDPAYQVFVDSAGVAK